MTRAPVWVPTRRVPLVALSLYVGSIVFANWLIARFGYIPVAPGVLAPAGVYAAALAFPTRDLVQRGLGRWVGAGAIVVGAALSWLVAGPTLALASGVTFLCSEGLDFAVFSPAQRHLSLPWAILLAGVPAVVVDSLMFLGLAHIPYSVALAGQLLAKMEVLLFATAVAPMLRRSLPLRAEARVLVEEP